MAIKNVSDLEYDWVTVLHEKGKAVAAYDKYIEDAKAAGSQACVELFEKLKQSDADRMQEIRQHLIEVMQKGKM
ncbi:hypothetical protein [Myxosarcina sp. GI1(2024)]